LTLFISWDRWQIVYSLERRIYNGKKNSKVESSEIDLRKLCVDLHAEGKNPTEIQKVLKRSRQWVYKWLTRAASADPEWYVDKSKAPYRTPTKIDVEVENAIVGSRVKLSKRDTDETRYAFCGAIAIHQELDHLGYKDKPSLSTINRVLKRHGLISQHDNERKKNDSKKHYPEIAVNHPGHVHQLDLVTPRYIKGFGAIISINRIDVFTAQANLEQFKSKAADSVIRFLINDWKAFGIPRYLQLDNEAAFRGSLYHPKTFGKLSRFCLNFGVEILFIPFNEPWRNAHIESFNSRFDKHLWQGQVFTDLEHLRSEAKKFRDKHNLYQEYRKSTFSQQSHRNYTARYLPQNFAFEKLWDLPVTRGKIHFVRLVEEAGTINILNEDFHVDRGLSFEYVWATVDTGRETLEVYYQPTPKSPRELIASKPYRLRERVKNRIPAKTFCKVSTMSWNT